MLLLFSVKFRKKYRKLQPKLRDACNERLRLFESNPFHPLLENHPLHEPYAGCRSISITGDYRAIYRHEAADIARFIAIDTHHNLYGT